MRIFSFYAENFRTIEGRQELPITDDTINLITAANNGRGKSSWLYCFYFLICDHSIDTIKAYVNWDSTSMACGIKFEYLGKIFKIDYSYSNSISKKTLVVDNEEFNTPTSVNKKLREYFQPSIFLNATALFQGTKNFVAVKDSERRENLQQIFNLDYSQEIKDIEKEEKELQVKELDVKEKELLVCLSKTFTLQPQIEKNITEEEYTLKLSQIEENKKLEVDTLTKIAVIENTKKEKSLLSAKATLEASSIENNKAQLAKLENELTSLQNYTQDFSYIDSLKEKVASITLERIRVFDETELTSTRQELADKQASLKVLQKKLSDCKSGKCPTCAKDFESKDISLTENEIASLKDVIQTLQTRLSTLVAEQTSYQEKVRQNESKKRDKELFESKIESQSKALEKELSDNIINIEKKKTDIEQKKALITEKESNLLELNSKLASIEVNEDEKLNRDIRDIREVIKTLSAEINTYESIASKNNLIEKQNKEATEADAKNKEKITSIQGEIDKLTERKSQLEKMKFFLKKEFPSYVISSMIKQIENDMNEFINKVYYKSLDVEIRGSDDKISVLYGTGKEKVDCVNASGAEEKLLSISFCYALNKLKHYDILMLDEVDESMTEENAMKLAEMVNVIQNEYDFIGVVSHVNAVKDYYSTIGANIIEVDKE